MKTLAAVTSDNECVEIEISILILKEKWLSGAKLVPPLPLVNKMLSSGSARYDHWREVRWIPLVISSDDYSKIAADLCEKHKFTFRDGYEVCDDRIMWEAIQTVEQTGGAIEQIYPAIKRIGLLEKLLAVLRDEDAEDENSDVAEFITLNLSRTIEFLQEQRLTGSG